MSIEKTARCDGTPLENGAQDEKGRRYTPEARAIMDQQGWHVGDDGRLHDPWHAPIDPRNGARLPAAHVAQERVGNSTAAAPKASGTPPEPDAAKRHRDGSTGQYLADPHGRPWSGPAVTAAGTDNATDAARIFRRGPLR